jgi:hypothetical protein
MSYAIKVSSVSATESSYEAAVKATKAALAKTAENIRTNHSLFRSPKTRTAFAAALAKVSFPKKAGNVNRVVAGIVPVSIVRA